MTPTITGILVIAIPALLLGYILFWKNLRPVFWMVIGAAALGIGYLFSTDALKDVGGPVHDIVFAGGGLTGGGSPAGGGADSAGEPATESAPAAKTEAAPAASGGDSAGGHPADGRYVTE